MVSIISKISVVAVVVGVASLTVVLSVMNGFSNTIEERLLAAEPHISIENKVGFDPKWIDEARDFLGIKEVGLVETQDVLIRTQDGYFGGGVAKGLERLALRNFAKRMDDLRGSITAQERSWVLSLSDVEVAQGDVILGIDLARTLNVLEGDYISLIAPEALLMPPGEVPPFEKVRVKAVLYSRLAEIDGKMIFYVKGETLNKLKQTLSRRENWEMRLAEPRKYDRAKKHFKTKKVDVETWVDKNTTLFYALKAEKRIMAAFLTLSTLIASFSIVTVMVLLITQKRRDIGILFTLGMTKKRVQGVFQGIGLILAGMGILGGLGVGLIIASLIHLFPVDILPDIYYDTAIVVEIKAQHILLILVGGVLTALIGTYLSALSVSRLSPTQMLTRKR